MPKYPLALVIDKDREESLRSNLPPGHVFLHAYWNYYLRLLRETGRSEKTILNTQSSLNLFLVHSPYVSLESWNDARAIQEEFLRLKKDRNWSNSTYNTYRKGLSSYFRVLCDAKLVNENPMARIKKCPEVPHDQPKFEDSQISRLFETVCTYKTGTSRLVFYRNKLYCLLSGYTGGRPIELLSLKLSSFSGDRSSISIIGAKGSGKTRMYKLSEDAQEAVRNYVRECAMSKRDKELGQHLFLGNNVGKAWTYSGVRQVYKRLGERMGFKVTAYMFRRMVATKMFEKKIPLQDIQQHMGHTRASTTLRYVQSSERMNDVGIACMSDVMSFARTPFETNSTGASLSTTPSSSNCTPNRLW